MKRSTLSLFILIVVFLLLAPLIYFAGKDEWLWNEVNSALLLMSLISIPLGFEKRYNIDIAPTLAGDIYFIGVVLMLPIHVGIKHWYIILGLLIIPCLDIIIFMIKQEKVEKVDKIINNCNYLILSNLLIFTIVSCFVFYYDISKASVIGLILFVFGFVICISNILFFVRKKSFSKIPNRERTLSFQYIGVPLSLAVNSLSSKAISMPGRIAMGLVSFLILLAIIIDASRLKRSLENT